MGGTYRDLDKDLADSRVAWTNLLLCCDGDEHTKQPSHCDVSKQGQDVCRSFRNPSLIPGDHDLLVSMRKDGYLEVRSVVFGNSVSRTAAVPKQGQKGAKREILRVADLSKHSFSIGSTMAHLVADNSRTERE